MARPKTGDKRTAILEAASAVIATDGIEVSTAKIAKTAGVAEGSLFRYFADKDLLLNELYLELKGSMRIAMTVGFPGDGSLKTRARHLWKSYVVWGIEHPSQRKTMAQLTVSERILPRNRREGQAGFSSLSDTVDQIRERGRLCGLSHRFAGDLFLSMAEATMTAMTENPARAEDYQNAGFDAFWSAVAKS